MNSILQVVIIYLSNMQKCLLFGLFLVAIAHCAYEPELLLTAKSQFINKFIGNYSDTIIHTINNYSIPDPDPIEQKVAGVKVTVTLKQIKQKIDINWVTNVMEVVDKHTFKIHSKNINITLDAQVDAKIGVLRRQKGPLKISITKLDTNVSLAFTSAKCPKSVGFDLQVRDVFVNAANVSIKIQGKSFDNTVINLIQKYITPRVPGLLQQAITTQVNPLISKYTCNRIEEQINVKENKYYILIVNTTEVPEFDGGLSYLRLLVDVTLQNMITNETNDQLQRDDLPGDPAFSQLYDLSISASSNFLNTALWLVGDAQLLSIKVDNSMLGDNPPILLNTTNLSILLPNLNTKEWANKEVFLMITPSTKYQHLVIRSGRVVSVISLSIKFVVNVTGSITNATECIEKKQCVIACDLNMTLPLSVALRLNQSYVVGLLHTASFFDVQVIKSQIEVNVGSFKSIVNSIVGSMIPSVNSELVQGVNISKALHNITQKYHIPKLEVRTFLDYIELGLNIDI